MFEEELPAMVPGDEYGGVEFVRYSDDEPPALARARRREWRFDFVRRWVRRGVLFAAATLWQYEVIRRAVH